MSSNLYGPPTFAQSRGHMGDFPAVRQLVAEAVSPVLRLRGGGVEAEAPSPAPAPPRRCTHCPPMQRAAQPPPQQRTQWTEYRP